MNKILLIFFLFAALKSRAQLPSEKNSEDMYSVALKQKLQLTKQTHSSEVILPSNAPLLQEVTVAKMKISIAEKKRNEMDVQKKLPSNSDAVYTTKKFPKKR